MPILGAKVRSDAADGDELVRDQEYHHRQSSGSPHWDPRVRRRDAASARPDEGGAASSTSGSEVDSPGEGVVRWEDDRHS